MGTEAEVVRDLAQKAVAPALVETEDGRKFLVTPDDTSVREISDEHQLKVTVPRYISQSVTVQARDSLVDYINRYKGSETTLLADIDANTIVGLIDYHGKDQAAHVAHRATLRLSASVEWALWTKISGQLMPQLEFARFIEENGADIMAPAAADLLEAVRDLQAHRKVNFTKAVRTASDNENFEFTSETEAKTRGGIELPTRFVLGIPVYFGEPDTEIHAFLRWKIDPDEGGLKLGIALHRAEHVRQSIFQQIVLDLTERTGQPAIFGKL